jgi:hypothetical protein
MPEFSIVLKKRKALIANLLLSFVSRDGIEPSNAGRWTLYPGLENEALTPRAGRLVC